MRAHKTVRGETYHITNYGIADQIIFSDEEDYTRFLFLILHLQSSIAFNHLSRPLPYFKKHGVFETSEHTVKSITKSRYVELISFVLTPKGFALLVRETKEGGIPYFMQRVQNAYTKFFNTKYRRHGHLFCGPYRYTPVLDQDQLSHLSAHLHIKVRDIPLWKGREDIYPWSSFQDYSKNRFGTLLVHETITEKFKSEKEYRKFVLYPSLKERKKILGEAHFLK